MGRRRCAWCGRDLGEALGVDGITYGMCPECYEREMAALNGRPRTGEILVWIVKSLPAWAAAAAVVWVVKPFLGLGLALILGSLVWMGVMAMWLEGVR